MLNLHSDILKYASALKYAPVRRTTPRKYAKFEQYLSKNVSKISNMQGSRRDFLKKSLKVGAVGGTVLAAAAIAKPTSDELAPDDNGVVVGKSSKKEVLYKKSKEWEYYYKIAY